MTESRQGHPTQRKDGFFLNLVHKGHSGGLSLSLCHLSPLLSRTLPGQCLYDSAMLAHLQNLSCSPDLRGICTEEIRL